MLTTFAIVDAAEEVLPEEVLPEEVLPEELLSGEVLSGEVLSEELLPVRVSVKSAVLPVAMAFPHQVSAVMVIL